jgi:hypothetical protein
MEPNPYAAPRSLAENSVVRTSRREKLLKRLVRTGLVLLILSPVLYLSGVALVSSATNMRPDRSRPRAKMGELVGKSGVAAFWMGMGLMILPLFVPLPRSEE